MWCIQSLYEILQYTSSLVTRLLAFFFSFCENVCIVNLTLHSYLTILLWRSWFLVYIKDYIAFRFQFCYRIYANSTVPFIFIEILRTQNRRFIVTHFWLKTFIYIKNRSNQNRSHSTQEKQFQSKVPKWDILKRYKALFV